MLINPRTGWDGWGEYTAAGAAGPLPSWLLFTVYLVVITP
jgi:hypothetical protein